MLQLQCCHEADVQGKQLVHMPSAGLILVLASQIGVLPMQTAQRYACRRALRNSRRSRALARKRAPLTSRMS
jgi:hypothetical protein